jgi:hypothetical protein
MITILGALNAIHTRKINMIGIRFGNWIVIDRYVPRFVGPDKFEYYCRCSCGAKKWFQAGHINDEEAPVCDKCSIEKQHIKPASQYGYICTKCKRLWPVHGEKGCDCTDVPVSPDRIVDEK